MRMVTRKGGDHMEGLSFSNMDHLPHYSAWYETTLLECGPHKLDAIKLVRVYRYLGLKENKQLVENVRKRLRTLMPTTRRKQCAVKRDLKRWEQKWRWNCISPSWMGQGIMMNNGT